MEKKFTYLQKMQEEVMYAVRLWEANQKLFLSKIF